VINIWRIEYAFSIPYQKKVVEKVTFETCLFDTTFVTSLNMSQVNCNILFTGGNDSKIKVWNLRTGICEREFPAHASGVADMVVVENLYEYSSNKNYFVFSIGVKDEVLSLSTSTNKDVSKFDLKKSVANKFGEVCSPCMQILPSDKNSEGIKLVLASEGSNTSEILIVNIK
jgi:WD40 repeat protein